MQKIVVATNNKGKLKEFNRLCEGLGMEVLSLADFPQIGEIVEDGKTFDENALIKARAVYRATGLAAIGDDSGLEVDYLGGAPGIYSARYSGEHGNDKANNEKLLNELLGVPTDKRTARFRCSIGFVTREGKEYVVDGSCEGVILTEVQGERGFGYDPLFFVEENGKSFAELSLDEKNSISHRGKANAKLLSLLKQI